MRTFIWAWLLVSALCAAAFAGVYAFAFAGAPGGFGTGFGKAMTILFGGLLSSAVSVLVIALLVWAVTRIGRLANDQGKSHGPQAVILAIIAILVSGLGLGYVSISGNLGFLGVMLFGVVITGAVWLFAKHDNDGTPSTKIGRFLAGAFSGWRLSKVTPPASTTTTASAAAPAPVVPVPTTQTYPPAAALAAMSTGTPTP